MNPRALIIAVGAASTFATSAMAYETDQFSNRSQPITDSTEILNLQVNKTIEGIVADWRKGRDEKAFVNAVYHKIGGLHWVDKLESWASRSPEVEKLDTRKYHSVYSGLPIWSVRVTFFFGVGKTLRLGDELIGSDKIGHFLSQGRKFYRRYLKHGTEARAAKQSAYTERAIFGKLTTGTYSNADLVANYEGYRFYRSLFEDDIVAGKPAILRWEGDGWVIQREFDWADHVNPYWDEALNINHYDWLLYKRMRARFLSLCPQYWEQPSLYSIENEDEYRLSYAHLKLLDTSELRLDTLCPAAAAIEHSQTLVPSDRTDTDETAPPSARPSGTGSRGVPAFP